MVERVTNYDVMQDGADFYMFEKGNRDHLVRVVTYPHGVRDMDFVAAQKARAWFEEWGYFKGGETVRWVSMAS